MVCPCGRVRVGGGHADAGPPIDGTRRLRAAPGRGALTEQAPRFGETLGRVEVCSLNGVAEIAARPKRRLTAPP